MSNPGFLRLLLPCVLVAAAACGDDAPSKPTEDNSDPAGEGDADAGDDATLDAGGKDGGKDGGKLDASSKPAGDASVSSDAGPKVDAGISGLDGGARADASAPAQADASAPPPASGLRPKCVKKDSQVMIIGDSYINWVSHTFPQDIVTASKQNWRMLAVGGYSMGSGGIGLIPTEYDDSIKMDPDAHTILMDGGGNDVLVADPALDPNRDCLTAKSPTLPQCQMIIDKAIAAADALLEKASAAGIRDVVYFFYPHVPEGTLLGGPSPNTILDIALPQVKKFCDGVEAETSGKTRCTFIDMVPVFAGHDDWFFPGDIHPTSAGSKPMAEKIWQVMSDKCIGQKTGATCCDNN